MLSRDDAPAVPVGDAAGTPAGEVEVRRSARRVTATGSSGAAGPEPIERRLEGRIVGDGLVLGQLDDQALGERLDERTELACGRDCRRDVQREKDAVRQLVEMAEGGLDRGELELVACAHLR